MRSAEQMQKSQENHETLLKPAFNYSRLGFNLCASKLWEKKVVALGASAGGAEYVHPHTRANK
jgi:hypothetical protein